METIKELKEKNDFSNSINDSSLQRNHSEKSNSSSNTNNNNTNNNNKNSNDMLSNSKKIKVIINNHYHNFLKIKTDSIPECPYLGTIKRHLLDFDFEKLCSISLSNFNVYACLVCGKYFQGRGINTHAYTHSLVQDHHLFINLHNQNIYCLPDNYEVVDNSLNDIKYNLNPEFSKKDIENMKNEYAKALDGTDFIPGK